MEKVSGELSSPPGEQEYKSYENLNSLLVEHHFRTLPSGEVISVAGDGDTSIDRTVEEGGGWAQKQPQLPQSDCIDDNSLI